MDYVEISKIIGYPCHPLNDEGTIALIEIPFTFTDGDDVPAYVEVDLDLVRFFDDGELFDHFYFRGLFRGDEADTGVLSTIAASNAVSFTDELKLEVGTVPNEASAAFANYMAAMLAFVSWEKAWEACEGGEMPVLLAK
ncbi:MAG TPA: DUF1828 domain-containing protein [Telluria sp.]|nr:DUF1828 domain-containing protein [Telluria sp.]